MPRRVDRRAPVLAPSEPPARLLEQWAEADRRARELWQVLEEVRG